MTDPTTPGSESGGGEVDKPVTAILAEMTGRDESEFEVDGDYDYPHPDDLESVPEDER